MRRTFPSEAQRVARQHSTASPSQGCRTRGTVRSDDPDSLSIAPEQYSQFYRVGQVTAPGPVAVGNASRGGNSSVQLARAAPIMPGRNSRLQVQQGRVVVAHRSFLRPQPNAPQEALKPCARQERHLLHKWVPTDRSTRRNSGSRRRQQSVALVLDNHGLDFFGHLPFSSASGSPDADHLADSILESLINGLAKVLTRSTVFRHKGSDAEPSQVRAGAASRRRFSGRIDEGGENIDHQCRVPRCGERGSVMGSITSAGIWLISS